mmetsp:Transcript_26349/g.61843  ORF Transcript_26349/g.61843 Transcript_26349/m.61843 type:complete len:270 (+) Transcript_26349:927-1736(+)
MEDRWPRDADGAAVAAANGTVRAVAVNAAARTRGLFVAAVAVGIVLPELHEAQRTGQQHCGIGRALRLAIGRHEAEPAPDVTVKLIRGHRLHVVLAAAAHPLLFSLLARTTAHIARDDAHLTPVVTLGRAPVHLALTHTLERHTDELLLWQVGLPIRRRILARNIIARIANRDRRRGGANRHTIHERVGCALEQREGVGCVELKSMLQLVARVLPSRALVPLGVVIHTGVALDLLERRLYGDITATLRRRFDGQLMVLMLLPEHLRLGR